MNKLIAHALVKNKNEEILITKRCLIRKGKINFEGGKWDIPGGTVEYLEYPSVAVVREVKEEVSLDVEITKVLLEKSNLDVEKQIVFTTLVYSCKTLGDLDVVLSTGEHDEYKWIKAAEVLEMDDSSLVSYLKEAIILFIKGSE